MSVCLYCDKHYEFDGESIPPDPDCLPCKVLVLAVREGWASVAVTDSSGSADFTQLQVTAAQLRVTA